MMRRDLPSWFEEDRYVPPPGSVEQTRVWQFMQHHGIATYHDLLERALDPEWFYPAAIADLGLEWPHSYHTLYDTSGGVPWTKWFVGGRTNIVHHTVEKWATGLHAKQPAIYWSGEDGATSSLTFRQLSEQVSRAAAGLRVRGIGVGDVVAIYMPMIPEAAITILAACRIGAIAAPSFSGYGADALAERLRIGRARALVCADGFWHAGRRIEMKPIVDEAVGRSPTVETVVVVPRLGLSPEMVPGRDIGWEVLMANGDDGDLPMFTPETPCYLAFTSGSSGRPKGAVHCQGRFLYRLPIETAYNFDVGEGDRFLWVSDMGWIMGPGILIGALSVGATFVMLEGSFAHPEPNRLWELVERLSLTHLGLSPTVVRLLAGHGDEWVAPYDLESLRVLGSTGEPMTSHAWRWLHRQVGRGRMPIINISGGTEIGGAILSGNPIATSPECTFAGPSIGMAADVFDNRGSPVTGTPGELVVTAPWPSMTWGFWNESERYLETYWSRWEDVWVHGDRALRRADGTWELPGRSDDLIKVAGKRIGPTEYESAATEVKGVLAAAAVGIPDAIKGEVAVLVILPTEDAGDHQALEKQVYSHVTVIVGRPMRPEAVLVVPDIPLTRSGKIHRRAVRSWLSGVDPGDLSNLENPDSRDAIRTAAARVHQGESSRRDGESD